MEDIHPVDNIPESWELNNNNKKINTITDLKKILEEDITNKIFYQNSDKDKVKIIYTSLSKNWMVLPMIDSINLNHPKSKFDHIEDALNESIQIMTRFNEEKDK